MGRTRNEELHKIQDLGLIRDERDRELERTSRSRACSVLVTVSLHGAGPAPCWSPSPC